MWHPRPALDVQLKTNFSFGLRTKSWPDFHSRKNQSSPRCLVSFSWSHLYSMSLGQVFKCLVVSPTQPGPSVHKRDLALPSPAWPSPHDLSPSSSPFLLIPSLYFWTTYNQSYALLGSHAHPTTPDPPLTLNGSLWIKRCLANAPSEFVTKSGMWNLTFLQSDSDELSSESLPLHTEAGGPWIRRIKMAKRSNQRCFRALSLHWYILVTRGQCWPQSSQELLQCLATQLLFANPTPAFFILGACGLESIFSHSCSLSCEGWIGGTGLLREKAVVDLTN